MIIDLGSAIINAIALKRLDFKARKRNKKVKLKEVLKMAPRKGNLMTVRTDVKVLDATIRDGGLCNNFEFTDEFVTELYKTNVKSGVDYMEFGYRASKNLFDPKDFGKWKFCSEEDIRSIVGENVSDMKIAVMADVGRCDFKEDFIPKSESVIDMVRVACYIHQIPAAIEMIEHFHNLGYETTCNIMAISQANTEQIDAALEMLGAQSHVDVIYLVDSYGSLYPESAANLSKKYLEIGEKYGKAIGFHAHNNQNLAFANTIETLSYGVSYRCNRVGYGQRFRKLCHGTFTRIFKEPEIQPLQPSHIY